MRRDAAFRCSTPFDAARSSAFSATWSAAFAPAASPLSSASRTFFTAPLTPVRTRDVAGAALLGLPVALLGRCGVRQADLSPWKDGRAR